MSIREFYLLGYSWIFLHSRRVPRKVNAALAQTDMKTIGGRVKFEGGSHFSRGPLVFTQWFKTTNADQWESKVVWAKHDFFPANAMEMFPRP